MQAERKRWWGAPQWRTALIITTLAWSGMSERSAAQSVDATLGGGSPHGMFSVVGEAVTEAVRREYPGSSFAYESGNNAGSLLRMLRGDIAFSMAAPGEVEAALNGEKPFPAKFEKPSFGMVARLLDGLVGYIAVSAEFVEENDLESLADVRRKRLPVRLSTNQLGNLSTVRFGRELLAAHDIDEALINQWGGKDYHLPNSASFDLLRDGRLDLIITFGLHPEARVLMAATKRPIRFLPIDPAVARRTAERLNTDVGVIPAGTYEFLETDYTAPAFGGGIAAGAAVDSELVYRVTRAIHRQIEFIRSVHPALQSLSEQILPAHEPYLLHPGAARYYREVGLLSD